MGTTTIATRGAANFPVAGGVGNASSKKIAWGSVDLSANPAPTDIFQMCRVPKGAVIVGGRVMGDKLDSIGSGSALLDMDVGLNDGGTRDTDALGNFGVWNGAAIAGVKPESGHNFPLGGLLIQSGPITCANETIVEVAVVASALAFATGTLTVEVDYYVP
jgi:hypothetical protein